MRKIYKEYRLPLRQLQSDKIQEFLDESFSNFGQGDGLRNQIIEQVEANHAHIENE